MSTCHLCDAPLADGILVGTTGRHGEVFDTYACGRCGLVQTTPLPSDADLAAYYAGPYRATFTREPVNGHEWGTPEAERLMDEGAREYAAEIVAALGLGHDHDVLEVGCGDGRLAAALGAHCRICALEADPEMAREAARRIPVVYPWTLAEYASTEPLTFDAIVSCHVLEHFREPLVALSQMRLMLRPGGRVWLEVPNTWQPYNDLDAHYWQRPHLYNFTAHTLMLTMLRAGFSDVNVAEHGHVLLCYATSGDAQSCGYDEAHARVTAAWGQPPPTAEQVAAHLDGYRQRWHRRRRNDRAVEVLHRFREGEDVDLGELRDAFDVLGAQSHTAARIASRAIRDGAAVVEMLDGLIEAAEAWSPDPWQMGYLAGQAATAARVSHTLGNLVNAWKALEVEGTR